MKSAFLKEVAESLYSKFGEGVSELNVVFPNKRARLFFEKHLRELIDKPIWQPRYDSIDALIKQYAELEVSHELKLISVLYQVYVEVTKEDVEFDKFYSFGEILLSDFDTLDKYMVNSKRLFKNISDLGEIDDVFNVNDEQTELIELFWSNYNRAGVGGGAHYDHFSNTWRYLEQIYRLFNYRLREQKVGYSGMIYRSAARNILRGDVSEFPTFVFVGFNALNSCEKTIFKFLQNNEKALFYWDCDRYYLNNVEQEAGLFLRRNVALFGGGEIEPTREFSSKKSIEVVKVPSEILQAKVLHDYLNRPQIEQSETAVILTDENLLPVVISFIPQKIDKLNITMGGQITQSVPYVFFERVVRAQKRRKDGLYHVDDVKAICAHPLVRHMIADIETVFEKFVEQGVVYSHVRSVGLDALNDVFVENNIAGAQFGAYLDDVVKRFCFSAEGDESYSKENNEYAEVIIDSITRLNNIIVESGIDVSTTIYLNLLNQIINRARIAYIGEPLDGMQLMGILESRCVDFKNVFMLSITDEVFPSSSVVQSYIPHNLRRGFGLPTQVEHAAVWAYYFYRLIQRAENVTLIYAATTGVSSIAEPSRYIYQLEYESGHEIVHTSVQMEVVGADVARKIEQQKNSEILRIVKEMTYSPSKINDYIDCPLKFCYKHIKKISVPQPIDQIASRDTGNILHKVLEKIYKPLKKDALGLLSIVTDREISDLVDLTTLEIMAKRLDLKAIDNSIEAAKRLIVKYVRSVINFDLSEGILRSVEQTEKPMSYSITINGILINLYGVADRVDILNDGNIRVVDYKSGVDRLDFESVESLFVSHPKRNKAALQTFIYSLMGRNSTIALYNVKQMSEEGFSPFFICKETGEVVEQITNDITASLDEGLKAILEEILSEKPFVQCDDVAMCRWCDFDSICNRKSNDGHSDELAVID